MITKEKFQRIHDVEQYLAYVPYDVARDCLYDGRSLYNGYVMGQPESFAETYDQIVYDHYRKTGPEAFSALEAMARSLHDHHMRRHVKDMLTARNPRRMVGVMGGHGLLRTDDMYRKIVLIAKRLTEGGFTMVTGGGPGAMEATHLGSWMAGRTVEEVDAALAMLQKAPKFDDERWLETALRVMLDYPQTEYQSLGIPTWLYGHEPATPFATHIAKFFDNSVREDLILTCSFGGIIYTPGSAGTMQEIFQDAVQNHYLSFGFASPMAFLGWKFWTDEMPVYPFLEKMQAEGKYKNLLLSISDEVDEVVQVLERFQSPQPPKGRERLVVRG